jgi:hypothetical protein
MSITSYPDYTRLTSTGGGNIVQFGGGTTDAFGRLRVSEPYTLFDSQNRFQIDPQFDTATSGSATATHLSNESSVAMAVTTSSGDEVIRQTKRVFPYQPGKSLLALMTFVMAPTQTNLRQRVGYFGANDGLYLEQNDTDVRFVLRKSTSGSVDDTEYVTQANWNVDKFDGTGPSGITLDFTKSQILFFDIEWLGVGDVRCGFYSHGKPVIAHIFHNENVKDKVYMKTAILPVRYEITATGALSSGATLRQICSTVASEGGYQQDVVELAAQRTTALTGIDLTTKPLISLRLNSSSLDAVVLPQILKVLPTTGQDYIITLVRNATLTGASWNTSAFTNVDYDVSATAMTGGDIVQLDYITNTVQAGSGVDAPTGYKWSLQLGRTIGGTSDIVTIGIRTAVSGTPAGSALGSLIFYDLTNGV